MALQQNVFENGAWVTRTVDTAEFLRQAALSQTKLGKQVAPKPPTCGLLTRTIIDSPVILWALPCQLRSSKHNDVALIGENYVQICELREDCQLQDVIRKHDFGSRIRNAQVIGPSPEEEEDDELGSQSNTRQGLREDNDINMTGSDQPKNSGGHHLDFRPRQFLVLVLEQGDLVFLYVRKNDQGRLEFVSYREEPPASRLVYPGYHMAVDPTSRYLVLGCARELFVIYELTSLYEIHRQLARNEPFRPIKAMKPRSVQAVIHKIEFLHPQPEDNHLLILLLLFVQDDGTKLVIYDWEDGDSLDEVFKPKKQGHRLDEQYQMPLFIVPLKVCNAFLLINENGTAICRDLLSGPPRIETFEIERKNSTLFHFGSREPLWTAWTRPTRDAHYHQNHDVIYLAREDGLVAFLEFNQSGLLASINMEFADCNIDSAFASMSNRFGDTLITCGESGPGGIWNVMAREKPTLVGHIPNWSPTVDFTTTSSGRREADFRKSSKSTHTQKAYQPRQPDRIFTCSGRGVTGTVTELRYGLHAALTAIWDNGAPVRQCWPLLSPAKSDSRDDSQYLIAFPDSSLAISVSPAGDPTEIDEKNLPYDFSCRTLALSCSSDAVVQVTTRSVVVVQHSDSTRHLLHDLDQDPTIAITAADIYNDTIALVLVSGSTFRIKIFSVEGLSLIPKQVLESNAEVTCISLGQLAGKMVAVAGEWHDLKTGLSLFSLEDIAPGAEAPRVALELEPENPTDNVDPETPTSAAHALEAATSIQMISLDNSKSIIVAGFRSGDVLTMTIDALGSGVTYIHRETFGPSAAQVYSLSTPGEAPSLLVCCHSELVVMADYVKPGYFREKLRVIMADPGNPSSASPPVHAVAAVRKSVQQGIDVTKLISISGAMIYISELQPHPRTVPRHLSIKGTPTRVIYSPRLDALVVAMSSNGLPSLRFLDLETGEDISRPVDKDGQDAEYISGLGEPDDHNRVLALKEWRYEKGGRTWEYIVMSLKDTDSRGRLLIISADRDSESQQASPQVRFYTRLKRTRMDKPIWSVATDSQGVFICCGELIQYLILDMEDKKLKESKEYELSSPAAWMEVVDGKLHVVTTQHSLEILDYKSNPTDDQMARLYSDDRARFSIHSIEVGNLKEGDRTQPVSLLSDVYCGVYGLWPPLEEGQPLHLLFQAEVQASVRKFARGKTRPYWSQMKRQKQYGRIPSSRDDTEILGLGIDGSLQHFSLLNASAWRLLRFLQNLAFVSPTICPFTPSRSLEGHQLDPRTEPRVGMQVNGDILQRCLDQRALEELVSRSDMAGAFRHLLGQLDNGELTAGMRESEDLGPYFDLAYRILEYHLSTVI